jgi:hypothetical protein
MNHPHAACSCFQLRNVSKDEMYNNNKGKACKSPAVVSHLQMHHSVTMQQQQALLKAASTHHCTKPATTY